MSAKVYPEIIIQNTKLSIEPYKPYIDSSIYDQPHISTSVKCMFFCSTYKRCLTILCMLCTLCIIILVIIISGDRSTSSSNPCATYTTSDLASSVSLECFRYLWINAGCKGMVPNGYNGWWLRSPQGGKTVLCTNGIAEEYCGAGNYGAIINNVYKCDLYYKGF
jgi:hypothetical protein